MPVNVRYIVHDVDLAVEFYTSLLGFEVDMRPAPGFARLKLGDLRLLLNRPGVGGAGQTMPDGRVPTSGGWNRFQIEVDDLDGMVRRLTEKGAILRSTIIEGQGGRQILVDDPAGNPVELFQSTR